MASSYVYNNVHVCVWTNKTTLVLRRRIYALRRIYAFDLKTEDVKLLNIVVQCIEFNEQTQQDDFQVVKAYQCSNSKHQHQFSNTNNAIHNEAIVDELRWNTLQKSANFLRTYIGNVKREKKRSRMYLLGAITQSPNILNVVKPLCC